MLLSLIHFLNPGRVSNPQFYVPNAETLTTSPRHQCWGYETTLFALYSMGMKHFYLGAELMRWVATSENFKNV
jgi:hypothetical protein